MTPATNPNALVLGGGGVTGIAWETGLLLGLAEAGCDVTGAELVLGTSAGSAVAAQITSDTALEKLYAAQLAGASNELAPKLSPIRLARMVIAGHRASDQLDRHRQIGRIAREVDQRVAAQRLAVIGRRLPSHEWPTVQELRIVTVDAVTGDVVVLDRSSGVSLVDAVAASCAVPAVWPTVTAGGRTLMDGGVRSGANADLVAGCNPVLVLAPMADDKSGPLSLSGQLSRLGNTTRTLILRPDKKSKRAMGINALNPKRAPASAEAGRAQGHEEADRVRRCWLTR